MVSFRSVWVSISLATRRFSCVHRATLTKRDLTVRCHCSLRLRVRMVSYCMWAARCQAATNQTRTTCHWRSRMVRQC
ncbi:hypothetical protein DPMN_063905 [Dreissena polymorpha]|uniref:Uncharacterized protein n=1 Tax=Dreissena polymorpha TaxID=45954 RepID=A0A9D4HKP6_DREPO|nr:hypothetical protein DPMN_063905 [Dreissena polymorpha]